MLSEILDEQAFLANTQMSYDQAVKNLYGYIIQRINVHISNKYRAQKLLDVYDIWQILKKVQDFDTGVYNLVPIKEGVKKEFERISRTIEKGHQDKISAIETEISRVSISALKEEVASRKIIINNLLKLSYPFDAAYKKSIQQYKRLKYQEQVLTQKLNKIKNSRPYLEKREVERILSFFEKQTM